MTTLVKTWTYAKKRLEAAGIDSPTIDARILLVCALNIGRNDLITDPYREVARADIDKLNEFLARRELREPVAHIVGKKGFWNLELLCDARALVPRPETEVIVDYVLKSSPESAQTVLDLGTGTGAILLALLAERPNWTGLGIDISSEALDLARENAKMHSLSERAHFQIGNWAENITEKFNIVTSNPPYIPTNIIATLDKDVREYDPHQALDGGADGLEPYHILFAQLPNLLKPNGKFAFEFGIGQANAIMAIAKSSNHFANLAIIKDLADKERVIIGQLAEK
ncbi:MAG: release factor glutamine methyltransferase [Hyphomonadaceae bacterium]|nr:MAG: release factor glutamine methyltransferase [Hyphomonadaceae bacterium]